MAITITGGLTMSGGARIVIPPPPPSEFDFSNPVYNSYTWPGDSNIGTVFAIAFGKDGEKFYVTDSTYNYREFDLSTPYDLSTATYVRGNNIPALEYSRGPSGMTFNAAGTRMVGQADWYHYALELSTAWDISTLTFKREVNINSQSGDTNYNGLQFNGSEDKIVTTTYQAGEVQALDVSWTSFFYNNSDKISVGTFPRKKGFAFDKTGSRFIIYDRDNLDLLIYTMTTPYDVTTGTLSTTYDVSGINPVGDAITNIVPSHDFTKIFLLNNGTVWMISQ